MNPSPPRSSGAEEERADDWKCDWCGEYARWLKWQDNSVKDTLWRQMYAVPGPTASPLRACDEHRHLLEPAPNPIEEQEAT